ncbi:hypothetical protein [Pelagicoccus mobilis]|uniref:Uncharacterized protein n=1 Tax=Pelagicoccus mobilis TaxID=415221 RepID=A0A934VRM3_9BACT|nr:hypothetical protein [Pelagicoccus mobilis]MBK1878105.1 hypothetical protein [Pelagicoccus mobilis]
MPKPLPVSLRRILLSAFVLIASIANAQTNFVEDAGQDEEEFFFLLEGYTRYGGDIEVIDGLTGEKYTKSNEVVKEVHYTLPQIMGGLHNLLLDYESRHMDYHLKIGELKESAIAEVAKGFGFKNFKMDRSQWLTRERAILRRLRAEPFFKIKEIVIWEVDKLRGTLPDNKYARHMKWDPDSLSWHSRVLTHWEVVHKRYGKDGQPYFFYPEKWQGLNLQTNEGFHIIDVGLPGDIRPEAFKEVDVSYPIIVRSQEDAQEQIKKLQRQIYQNFSHLYDPFTWIARRNVRFRQAYSWELQNYIADRGSKFRDRKWFDPMMARFITDIVTVELEGLEEVYDLYITQQFGNSKNTLGKDLDLLNWHEDEKREGQASKKDGKIWINFDNADGARLVLLDVYLRYGDKFLEALRTNITSVKKRQEARPLIRQTIEEVTGIPADKYIKAAAKAQKLGIEDKLREYRELRAKADSGSFGYN